jgi:predicted TIM-barrel fold metal-dependent hydrolase
MNLRIIDAHAHAFSDKVAQRAMDALVPEAEEAGYPAYRDGTLGSLLAAMDAAGVGRAVVCSIATQPRQAAPILEWSVQIADERLIPLASVHPDSADWRREIARIREARLVGVKLHAQYQRFVVDEPRMFPIYEALAEEGLLVVFHAGYDLAFPGNVSSLPRRFVPILDRWPGLRVVLTHAGGWQAWREARDVLVGRDVYLETSMSFGAAEPQVLTEILTRHRPDRILWGTDTPWADVAVDLAAARAFVPESLHEAYFWGNAERLFLSGVAEQRRAGSS